MKMRKRAIVMAISLATILSLAACGNDSGGKVSEEKKSAGDTEKEKIEEMLGEDPLKTLYEANLTKKLLEDYDSVSCEWKKYLPDGDVEREQRFYASQTSLEYLDDSGWYWKYEENKDKVTSYSEEDDVVYQTIEGVGDSALENFGRQYHNSLCLEYNEKEIVESVEIEDGDVIVEASLPFEEVKKLFGDRELIDSMKEEDTYITRYVHDEKDLSLKELESYIRKADGTELTDSEVRMSYNAHPIVPPEAYTEAFKNPETETLVCVYDPGTEDEQTFTTQIVKEAYLQIWCDRELYPTIYIDPECTIPYVRDSEETVGKTLYFAKGK